MDADEPTQVMKQDALGRVTVPRERREAWVDEFERSGLPATQFAATVGVNYQTFAWWVQQRRHARGDYARKTKARSAALRLVEAVPAVALPPPQDGGSSQMCPLQMLLPCGVRLLISDARQAALAAQLLNSLRASSSC